MRGRPACMSDAEIAAWTEADDIYRRRAGTGVSPCVDCTTAFSDEMRAIGRCNGEPGTFGATIPMVQRAYRTEPYATAEERIAARRRTWRESSRRRYAAASS